MSENTILLFEIEEDEPVVDIDKQWEEWLKKSEPEKNKIENITLINDEDKWLEELLKELEQSDKLLKKLDQTLKQPLNEPQKVYCYDHLGKKFESFEKMCEFHDVPYEIYLKRIECGWTRDNAISSPVKMDEREECEDHLGNKFPFLLSMCMHWHIKQRHYKNRIAAGWTVESALTTPVDPYKPIVDHLGNEFSSIDKFCTYWKISFYKYYDIVDNHQLFKDYLIPVPCKDHLGNEFPHDKAMCEYYGITRDTYARRLSKGDSLEEALRPMPNYECYDHLGNHFLSLTDMCIHWNVNPSMVANRLKNGCDIATALTSERKCSFLEVSVQNYLKNNDVGFEAEYTFEDCRFKDTNWLARFDFYIPQVGIIEVDGVQHFKSVEHWGGKEHLEKNQVHDSFKTQYCEKHDIPLLRIRYDQLKNDVYKAMIDDFLANPAKYIKNHNTYMAEEEYYGAA